MILVIQTLIIYFVITGYGFLTKKIVNIRLESKNFFDSFFLGIVFLSFLGLLINIFFPLNYIVSYSIILIGILSNFLFFKKNIKNLLIEGLVLSIFVLILLSKSKVYDDFGLYHLPVITKITDSNIILGISNIHFRYGHIFSLFYSAALFNNHFISLDSIHSIMGLIYVAFIYFLYRKIFNIKNSNIIRLFSLFILIYYLCAYYDYGNHGLDIPASIFFFLVLLSSLEVILEKKIHLSLYKIFYFSIFLITLKISYLFVFLIPTYLFYNNRNKNIKISLKKIFILLIPLLLWVLTNFLTTSCLLYPKKEFCFKTSWASPAKNWQSSPDEVYTEISAWSKGWIDSFENRQPPDFENREQAINHMKKYLTTNWLLHYFKHFKEHVLKTIIISILILLILKLCFQIRLQKENNKNNKKFLFIFIIILLNIIFWFLSAPLIRFGFAYFIATFFLLFIFFFNLNFNLNKKTLLFLTMFALTIFLSRNLIPERVNNFNEDFYKPYPNKFSKSLVTKLDLIEINKLDSIEIKKRANNLKYLAIKYPVGSINLILNSTCHDIPSPCTHFREINFDKVFFTKVGLFKKISVLND